MKNLTIILILFVFFSPHEIVSQLIFNGIIDHYPAINPAGECMLSAGNLLVYGHTGTCRGANALLLDANGEVTKEISLPDSGEYGYSWYMGAIELHPDTILLWGYSQHGDDFPGGEHFFMQKQAIQSSWFMVKALDSLSSMPAFVLIDMIQLNQGEHIITLYKDNLLTLDRNLNVIDRDYNSNLANQITHLTPVNNTTYVVNLVNSPSLIYNLNFEVQGTLPEEFQIFQYLDENVLIHTTSADFILYDYSTQLFDTIPYDFGGINYNRVHIDPNYIYLVNIGPDSIYLMRVSHDLLVKESFSLPRHISDWEGYEFYNNLFFSYSREGFQSESLYAEIMDIDHPATTEYHDIAIDSVYVTFLLEEPSYVLVTLNVSISNHGSDTLREFVLHTQPFYVFNCASHFPYTLYQNIIIPPGGSGSFTFVHIPDIYEIGNTLDICVAVNHGNALLDDNLTNNGFCILNIVLATEDEKEPVYKIYPNPVSGTLYIESEKTVDAIEVFNLYGQPVYSTNIKSQYYEIEFDGTPGLYLVKVKMKDGFVHRWINKI